MEKLAGHQRMEWAASGPLVPPGGGYQERDATKRTMDPAVVEVLIAQRRVDEKANMERRADQIIKGLKHESYAAKRARVKGAYDD
jgi:hypothetical protein